SRPDSRLTIFHPHRYGAPVLRCPCLTVPMSYGAPVLRCPVFWKPLSKENSWGGLASPRAAETSPAPAIPARNGEAAITALVELVGDDLQACDRAIVSRMDS